MTPTLQFIFLLTGLTSALITGLFYAYSCSVNLGLAKLADKEYLHAMQSINRAILNPWFFASFMGTLILLPISTWMTFANDSVSGEYLLLGAALVYTLTVFGVTIRGNVPLNNLLDRTPLDSLEHSKLALLRKRFEIPWNRYNLVRTIGCVISFLLTVGAFLFNI